MQIRNKFLFGIGLSILVIAVLLMASDAGWGIFDGAGLWGTAIPLVFIAFGGYLLDKATNGTWWNRD